MRHDLERHTFYEHLRNEIDIDHDKVSNERVDFLRQLPPIITWELLWRDSDDETSELRRIVETGKLPGIQMADTMV